MNTATKIWSRVSKYLVPGALGILIAYGIASTHMAPYSDGAEMESGAPDCEIPAGSEFMYPYAPELKDIFFDENSYRLREDAKPVLDENVSVMKSEPEALVVIESYCDTNESLTTALGTKRSESVKEYVVGKGVDPQRIITVNKCNSYDMELIYGEDSMGMGGRVHFVAIDEPADDLIYASNLK